MPYQEASTPPLQLVIGLGFSLISDLALEKKIGALMHPASFEIVTIGASKEIKDYTHCSIELAKIAGELYRGIQELARPVFCIAIGQAFICPGNTSCTPPSCRHIVEVMVVLEEGRPLFGGTNLNRCHLKNCITDPNYRGSGTEEALSSVERFIIGRQRALQKKLPILKR